MFDIGASELLLIVVVAIVVIGPKDLPLALRTAGRWIGQMRRISGHFRSGIETMIREAEMEEMETKWREQNAAIMAAHPSSEDTVTAEASAEARAAEPAKPLADGTPSDPAAISDEAKADPAVSPDTRPAMLPHEQPTVPNDSEMTGAAVPDEQARQG